MGRVWALAGAVLAALLLLFLLDDFVGAGTLLTAGGMAGTGAAAAYLVGDKFFMRGVWLFVGVLIGSLGFVLGASLFPDTSTGLLLGGAVPVIIMALLVSFTKDTSHFAAALLGFAAIGGAYAHVFDLDPQSLNISLPIAMGWAVFPLGLGYLAGVLTRGLVDKPASVDASLETTSPSLPDSESVR